jgi:zinc transport system substrate-binding protein
VKKLKQGRWTLFIAIMLLFMFFGCTDESLNKQETDCIRIITTFYPMYDFTRNIIGSAKNIKMLIPSGIEPHDFEPSVKDMENITAAAAFIYNSDDFETWVPQAKKNINLKQTEVINAAQGIKLTKNSLDHKEKSKIHKEAFDPHIWLSPKLAMKEIKNIRNGLIRKFPNKRKLFIKNTQKYLKKLKKLDDAYQAAFKGAVHKKFITQHKAFSYLANDYGLKQVSIAGLSLEEVSPARLAELKQYVKKENLKVIYFEKTTSTKAAQTLAKEAGLETVVLNSLESLTKVEQKKGKDYVAVMKDNLKALKLTIK